MNIYKPKEKYFSPSVVLYEILAYQKYFFKNTPMLITF